MKKIFIHLLMWSVVTVLSSPASLYGSNVPDLINYQGFLTDALGNPVAPPGEYTVEFRIWDHKTATEAAHVVWGRAFKVVVVEGRFNVILSDDGDAIANVPATSIADAFADAERYIQLTITTTPLETVVPARPIEPRQRILSAPYAFSAADADHATSADVATNASQAENATRLNGGANMVRSSSSPGYRHQFSGDRWNDIPGLSVTITNRTGRPFMIILTARPGGGDWNDAWWYGDGYKGSRLMRSPGTYEVGRFTQSGPFDECNLTWIDTEVQAGQQYTYKWQVNAGKGWVNTASLVVIEL